MSDQSCDIPQEGLTDAPEAVPQGPKAVENNDALDGQDSQKSTFCTSTTSESSDTTVDETDTPAWLVNLLNTVLPGSDGEEDETDLDDPEVMDQKRQKFRIKVDECLAEALAEKIEKVVNDPEAVPQGPKGIENDDALDGQGRPQSKLRISATSESSSSDSTVDDTDTPAWLVNFINTTLSGSDDEEDEADLDDPRVMDQKRRKFRIKVDKCLAEALAARTEKAVNDPEAVPKGPKAVDDVLDGQGSQQSKLRISATSESSSSDSTVDETDTPPWLVNLLNTALSLSDDEEDEADSDDPEVMDRKRRKFRIKVDNCLAEALAEKSEKVIDDPEADN